MTNDIAGQSSLPGASGSRRYFILDAAHESKPLKEIWRDENPIYEPLFTGAEPDVLVNGPFLIPLMPRSFFAQWLQEAILTQPLGIFVTAACSMEELADKLRQRLILTLPSGATVLFRYYDPRVLLPFLESCDESARDHWLGPLQEVAALEPHIGQMQRYRRNSPELPSAGDTSFRLSEPQWSAVKVHTLTYQLASMLPEQGDVHSRNNLQERWTFAKCVQRIAQRFGLETPADFRILTNLSWRFGLQMWDDPYFLEWPVHSGRARAGQKSFADSLAAAHEGLWQRLQTAAPAADASIKERLAAQRRNLP